MSHKLGESIKLTAGIAPAAISAGSTNGLIIDRLGFFDAKVHLRVGAATGAPTAQGVALKLQTGNKDDGSDMADVDGEVIAALTTNNTEAELKVDLNSYDRYFRAVLTTTFTGGTSPAIPAAVTIALGNPSDIPV